MDASGSQLEVTRHGSIVVLTLKRPASGNRITARMAVEITAALERSIRRRSARIPVAFQIILLKILSSTYE